MSRRSVPGVIHLAMWAAGGIVLGGLVLLALGMLVFGPAAQNDERDHRPPSIGTRPSRAISAVTGWRLRGVMHSTIRLGGRSNQQDVTGQHDPLQ